MKFAAAIDYIKDKEKLKAAGPAHHNYLQLSARLTG
jgi:hypothetical protein